MTKNILAFSRTTEYVKYVLILYIYIHIYIYSLSQGRRGAPCVKKHPITFSVSIKGFCSSQTTIDLSHIPHMIKLSQSFTFNTLIGSHLDRITEPSNHYISLLLVHLIKLDNILFVKK